MQPPTQIALRPALAADLPHLTRLDLAANASHPLIALSPFTYPFQATKLFLAHLEHCFARPRTYGFLVATTTTMTTQQQQLSSSPDSGIDVFAHASEEREREGAVAGEVVVGFLLWRGEGKALGVEGNKEVGEVGSGSGSGEEEEEWDWEARLPAGADRKLWRRYAAVMGADDGGCGSSGARDESSATVIAIEKFAVAPRYQRRGIGSLLLQAFLHTLADRDGGDATICLRSSVTARTLYERFGWLVEREWRMDLGGWGRYHRAHVEFAMRRKGGVVVVGV
ncbi:hypothetical protein LZ554_001118 [Drepanopeziza brunnea f. sp. 'monogermtubi']|nr:hypothetical protein LZ554_001118 [Drepanopeziza brunnea f. sp. 'monogermtubi']